MLLENDAFKHIPERTACDILALNRNTVRRHRRRKAFCGPPRPRRLSRQQAAQPSALSADERDEVKQTLSSDAYCNQPPVQVYHSLLEQGIYLCSISTMHRILRAEQLNGERRKQRPPQNHTVPRLKATGTNEVWTWDITKLPTEKRGEYLSLYVVMDLFSRYIVAWMLSRKENSKLAQQLIEEAVERYDIKPNSLTVHQDRGMPMTAHCYLDILSDLTVTASHSRPRVSNDNPMSEAQFKTLKYQPDYPRKFKGYEHASTWCKDYFSWYNESHYHSNLAGYTPQQVYTGAWKILAKARQSVLDEAFNQHPQRFRKRPVAKAPPAVVEINPVTENDNDQLVESGVNFPTLPRFIEKTI
ncbi:IS3 family transposase [Idiomarina sp. 28-8]|jgi:putative transposase|uniref:IS3 family transposase n=1 Tax=Idiomarina sp. 28-8 TaxID=1260624 RepID=UPI0003095CA1|nr:IS3 family transposase [Idiomarina sp. 28-8]NWO04100.1 IS3 family transposase [Idiomarinaceae bacterium]|tara:strand:- start:307 stop:1380 length:1074 start_codon:yes stop_codon:yes gene_type:complete